MIDIKYFKAIRLHLGLSLEDIAREMHCTKQTISNIENGKSKHKMAIAFYEEILGNHLKETPINTKEYFNAIEYLYKKKLNRN
jgi:transcriptional regulator with XRE-family HTH domain